MWYHWKAFVNKIKIHIYNLILPMCLLCSSLLIELNHPLSQTTQNESQHQQGNSLNCFSVGGISRNSQLCCWYTNTSSLQMGHFWKGKWENKRNKRKENIISTSNFYIACVRLKACRQPYTGAGQEHHLHNNVSMLCTWGTSPWVHNFAMHTPQKVSRP